MSDKEKTHIHSAERFIKQTTMCPPACRMVEVCCTLFGPKYDERETVISEVIAIRTDHVERFYKRHPIEEIPPVSLKQKMMLEGGWDFECRDTEIHAIILHGEYGLIETDNDLVGCENAATSLLVVPPGTDKQAFDKMVSEVEKRLYSELEERLKDERSRHAASESAG